MLDMSKINQLISDFLKIMAKPYTLEIISLTRDSPKTQRVLIQNLKLSQSYISQILKNLEKSHIIASYMENKEKKFQIKNPEILNVIDMIRDYVVKMEKLRLEELFPD